MTTHSFDPADPYIDSNAVFGVTASLLANVKLVDDAQSAGRFQTTASFSDVEHDVVLAPDQAE